MPIPKRFIEMLPPFKKRVYQRTDKPNQQNLSNRWKISYQTNKRIEEAFLGTPASIGIPMAISLVSKMFGSG